MSLKTYTDELILKYAASFASVESEENLKYRYRFMSELTPRQEKLFLDEYNRLKKPNQADLFKEP